MYHCLTRPRFSSLQPCELRAQTQKVTLYVGHQTKYRTVSKETTTYYGDSLCFTLILMSFRALEGTWEACILQLPQSAPCVLEGWTWICLWKANPQVPGALRKLTGDPTFSFSLTSSRFSVYVRIILGIVRLNMEPTYFLVLSVKVQNTCIHVIQRESHLHNQ